MINEDSDGKNGVINKVEIHYFFRDKSHSMDAFTRNECEKELLQIIKEIGFFLNTNIQIESEAYREGGLREILKLVSKYGVHLTLVLTLFEILMSRIPVENKDLVQLQMENLKLDNELKKAQLEEIRQKSLSESNLNSETISEIAEIIIEHYKIIWHRSNFYKRVDSYHRIDSLSFQILNHLNNPIDKENVVTRPQFIHYILKTDTFPPNIDEDAHIDIISPVLTKEKFNWRGFYLGQIISFDMSDKSFRGSVLNKEVEFVTGTYIRCVLHQTRKIDENGSIKVVHSKVITVFDIITGDSMQSYTARSNHGKKKGHGDNQLDIDFKQLTK